MTSPYKVDRNTHTHTYTHTYIHTLSIYLFLTNYSIIDIVQNEELNVFVRGVRGEG